MPTSTGIWDSPSSLICCILNPSRTATYILFLITSIGLSIVYVVLYLTYPTVHVLLFVKCPSLSHSEV